MKNLFEQSRSHWVRYDRYELKTANPQQHGGFPCVYKGCP